MSVTIDEWNKLKDAIETTSIGDYLTDVNVDTLRTYIEQAKMTYEEFQQFLADNHLKVETDVEDEAVVKEVPIKETTTEQTHTISGEYNPYTGKKMKEPLTWTEKVTTKSSPYYTLAENVKVQKVDAGGGSGGSTSRRPTNFTKSAANSSNSSKNEPDKQDLLKDESDRYHDVNVELAQIKK